MFHMFQTNVILNMRSDCSFVIIQWSGIFLESIFWFRKEFPDAFLYLYTTIPYSWILKYSDSIKDIAERLQDSAKITQEELDCLGLRYMDVILIVLAFYLGSLFLSAAVPILIRMFIHGSKLMIHFQYNLLLRGSSRSTDYRRD